ncbi:MAG: hypothetical protein GXY83_30895 [Rhodopirellula sp.]|nr:hypothetical protein [Rhodopirellula sp.]
MMAVSWLIVFGFILASVLGVVLLALVVFSSERFRAAVKTLVMVPVVVLVAMAVLAGWQRTAIRNETAIIDDLAVEHTAQQTAAGTVATAEVAPPADQGTAEDGEHGFGRLFRALSKAMLKTVAEGNPPAAADDGVALTAEKTDETVAPRRPPNPDQPAWVDASAEQIDGTFRMAISAGPYATREECERELPAAIDAAVDEYARQYLGPKAAGRVALSRDYLRENVVREQWLETRQVSVSPSKQIPMVRLHVLLGFDRSVNDALNDAWRRAVIHRKLWTLGTLGTMLLLILSACWAYLKTDLSTGGAYRKRLRFVTGLAMAFFVLAGLAVLG